MDNQPNMPFGQNQAKEPNRSNFNPPPPPEVNLRTMASDTSSMERGEAVPVPESVLPPETSKEPSFRPETQAGAPMSFEEEKPKTNKLWVSLGWIVGIAAIVAIGYFVVYPIFFRSGGGESVPEATPIPTQTPIQIITPAPHSSYFITPPGSLDVHLDSLILTTISAALQEAGSNKPGDNSLREVVITDNAGSQVALSLFLPVFVPSFSKDQLASWFEDDFTAFFYYDENGVWPGYVAKIKSGVNFDDVRANIAAIENEDVSRFFLGSPGSLGDFKEGQVNNKQSRYVVGSAGGAAFSYTFLDNYLLISTNYSGAKKASALLGF